MTAYLPPSRVFANANFNAVQLRIGHARPGAHILLGQWLGTVIDDALPPRRAPTLVLWEFHSDLHDAGMVPPRPAFLPARTVVHVPSPAALRGIA